ncbi:hypothetical protein FHETE_3723 [Fusarium heterosporum]|uniref:Uncharacterized protein n=1 Tax=Fusarium heterosporum TaxID=42747 RepID=A0A8H5WWG5_FUSHE|nr:hypothetical protein FHETE_3723 [Fusarium heterosporum]
MDRLPPEITSKIISCLTYTVDSPPLSRTISICPLAPLATICRNWQPLVEAFTFRDLHLSTQNGLTSARKILTSSRLSYLRRLRVHIRFHQQRHAPNGTTKAFGLERIYDEITQLFNILTQIPYGDEPLVSLRLSFHNDLPPNVIRRVATLTSSASSSRPLQLPDLPMISYFELKNISYRLTASRAFYMTMRMPRLRELSLEFSSFMPSNEESLQRGIEIAQSLAKLPRSIHNFSLRYFPCEYSNDTISSEDSLTRQLCQFSQREGLKDLTVYGRVEPTIFWPADSDSTAPHWPTLKSFVVHPGNILPSGKALTVGEFERDHHPSQPNNSVANEFCRTAARCAAHMPKVEYCSVSIGDSSWSSLSFCTVFPEDPCLNVAGKLELEQETLEQWSRAARVHNLDFRVCIKTPKTPEEDPEED